jgi:hypothetical protein
MKISKIFLFFLAVVLYAKTEIYTYNLKLNYKEYENSKVLDKDYSEFGRFVGIGGKYSNKFFLNYYLKAEYAWGYSKYKGGDWSGNAIEDTQKGVYLFDAEVGVGKGIYLFYGYRMWNRGKSDNEGDYDEVYYWKYGGVKFSYKFILDRVLFDVQAGYQKAFDPKLKIKLGNQPILDLGSTSGHFVEIPLYFPCSDNLKIKFFYRYQYWHIHRSRSKVLVLNNKQYLIYEPESKTKNQYLGIGILYKF